MCGRKTGTTEDIWKYSEGLKQNGLFAMVHIFTSTSETFRKYFKQSNFIVVVSTSTTLLHFSVFLGLLVFCFSLTQTKKN